ncbi:putative Ig domain-containing protein [Spirosoma endophyticum]|uniref:SprB repeat-containing protein n=1 Tax=Spirosoma endophyticum TaxID=662367 RepID=A0A1I2DRB3_9BACT|nr:putative Ig domain-containing protein [Spirosoma endophyticum]SFE82843.1 SprB repeat-containing protein [Spirosoma endophyticum]
MTRLLSLLCLLTLVGSALAQPTLRIGGNTRVVGSGAVRLVYGGGSLTNNGSLSLTTGQFAANGSTTYGGTGAATVADLRFSHSTGSSTLNSLLSVTSHATLTANTALNANGQLYLRTDLFPSADMVNEGVLTGTVQGLVTKATLTTGAAPYNSQLSVNLNGSAMRYQWQSSPNNSQWTDVPNATGSTYTANVTVSTYYRCRLTTTNSSYDQTTPPAFLAYTGPSALVLTTSSSPNPVCAGSTATLSVTVTGGSGPYSYTWTAPQGIALSGGNNPTVSVTPGATVSGVQTVTLTVADAGSGTNTAFVNLTVTAPLTVALSASPSATLTCGQISLTLTAGGGTNYTFTNPDGSVLAGSGETRTVSSPGTYSVTVVSSAGCMSTTTITVISNTAVVTVSNPVTTTATINASVSQTFTASGGSGPYSYSLSSGSLPPGLSLATTGGLSGSPTQAGSFTAIVQATDANGCRGLGLPFVVTVGSTPSDLALVLFAQPALVYGPTSVSVVVSVYELNGVATSGPVSVKLSEDTMLKLGFDPAATSVGGKPVQNPLWRFSGPVDGMYTLTSTQPLPAGGRLSVGLSGPLTPGTTQGRLSVSATVVDPSGTETRLNNNQDAEVIEYFKK